MIDDKENNRQGVKSWKRGDVYLFFIKVFLHRSLFHISKLISICSDFLYLNK